MNLFGAWLEKWYGICYHQNIIGGDIGTKDLTRELAEVSIIRNYSDVYF